jgi:hypothetical protein
MLVALLLKAAHKLISAKTHKQPVAVIAHSKLRNASAFFAFVKTSSPTGGNRRKNIRVSPCRLLILTLASKASRREKFFPRLKNLFPLARLRHAFGASLQKETAFQNFLPSFFSHPNRPRSRLRRYLWPTLFIQLPAFSFSCASWFYLNSFICPFA